MFFSDNIDLNHVTQGGSMGGFFQFILQSSSLAFQSNPKDVQNCFPGCKHQIRKAEISNQNKKPTTVSRGGLKSCYTQLLPPAMAATSAAKSSFFFSMPSPRSKRAYSTREVLWEAMNLPTVVVSSRMNSCSSRQFSL